MTKSTFASTQRSATKRLPEHESSTKQSRRRPSVNITRVERGGQILVGAFGVLAGIVLLAAGGSAMAILFEVLLVVAGLDLFVTGALGHCPLYRKLGHVPTSLRRPA